MDESINKYTTYLECVNNGEDLDIKDYVDYTDMLNFFDNYVPNVPVFNENSTLGDFLSWFYDEFPLIPDKHLYALSDNRVIPISLLYLTNDLIIDHRKRKLFIYSKPDNTGDLYELCLSNLNLYLLTTVSHVEMDKHIMEQAKLQEKFDDSYF